MGKLAINGGDPVRTEPFPAWPVFGDEELHLLGEVLESGVWGVGGKMKEEFERRFAELQDAKYALAVANGTTAIGRRGYPSILHFCGNSFPHRVR